MFLSVGRIRAPIATGRPKGLQSETFTRCGGVRESGSRRADRIRRRLVGARSAPQAVERPGRVSSRAFRPDPRARAWPAPRGSHSRRRRRFRVMSGEGGSRSRRCDRSRLAPMRIPIRFGPSMPSSLTLTRTSVPVRHVNFQGYGVEELSEYTIGIACRCQSCSSIAGWRRAVYLRGSPGRAGVVKLADARDSKSRDLRVVRVRPPPPAPINDLRQLDGPPFF